MKFIVIFLLVTTIAVVAYAQTKVGNYNGKVSFKTTKGNWQLEQYAPNIVKANFTPIGYTTNENISDAVVLKALNTPVKEWYEDKNPNRSIQWKDFIIEVNDDAISFGPNKAVKLSNTLLGNEYKGFMFELKEGEKIFGGGERALPLNRRGYKFNLYNNPWYGYNEGADNLNYSVPFFTSSNGYGLFFDNPSKGYVDIGKTNTNTFEVGFVSGQLNFYVILGKTYKEILESYHTLTGKQPLPPRWAMGNLMSRFGYTSEAQVKDIAAKMKAANMPVDAVIFDLFWFGDSIKNTMGNLDWVNKTAWPNPTKMIGDFKKDGINTVLITEPFVLKTSSNYETSKQYHAVDIQGKPYVLTDFYFGEGGIIDIFRKDAQQWFWSKHTTQMNKGVEAWWGDLGEPEKHPADVMHNLQDLGFKRLFKADEVHNLYGHTWTKMLHSNYAKDFPNKRLFSLNRSGFAGSQRFNIFPWTGDVSRSWSGLKSQLPVLLGMSMSGVPYVHSDAGGFAGGEGDNELYIRWLQMAAFTPIFRPHGTALYEVDKNAFSFPSEAALIEEPYKTYAKEIIDWRYRLMPYNYNLAHKQSIKGEPLMAPMYYHFAKDELACQMEEQYMWGENILVSPVIDKEKSKLYLPKEDHWYHLTEAFPTPMQGFTEIEYNKHIGMPLNFIRAFVKEGSFIPMLPANKIANTQHYTTDSLEVHYFYSDKKSTYTLYDDDGQSKNAIAEKKYDLIQFEAVTKNKNVTIQITKSSTRAINKTIRLIFHAPNVGSKKLLINGKPTSWPKLQENQSEHPFYYEVSARFTGKSLKIEVIE